mmetsp:Transcript_4531/g.11083  ORF Transcript_4531/g.11083 Transcript_4531/m.11083 type:complete len:147 (-) Transcript_4531:241-681(-)
MSATANTPALNEPSRNPAGASPIKSSFCPETFFLISTTGKSLKIKRATRKRTQPHNHPPQSAPSTTHAAPRVRIPLGPPHRRIPASSVRSPGQHVLIRGAAARRHHHHGPKDGHARDRADHDPGNRAARQAAAAAFRGIGSGASRR